MATDHVKMFAQEYAPIAVQVSQQTGIAPSVLLAQWGMETDYGRKTIGHFNFGNIKDMSGAGTPATDNQTGSRDKYVNFESPEAFGDYYAHMMRRLYPNALNAGTDISKYAEGLRTGVKGSYAEDENYEDAIRGAHKTTIGFYTDPEEIPTVKPMTEAERIKLERQEAGTTDEPPKPEPREVIDPVIAAGTGALISGVGQVGYRPEYFGTPPDINEIKESARSKISTLEEAGNKTIASLQEAEDKAQRRHDIAADRLQKRMSNPSPIAGGQTLADLELDFKISQYDLQRADRELKTRINEQKAKVPSTPAVTAPSALQTVSAAPETPSIITDPNTPSVDQHTRAIQGTTVDDVTGRARQTTYNERTSQIARNAANQQAVLQALGQQGIVSPSKAFALTEGISGSTPSGVMVNPDLAGERQQQAELEQRMVDDKTAQERLAQQNEMDRLKEERALAAQRQSQAQSALTKAQSARTAGVTRAQTAAETAEDRALAARQDLESGRKTAQEILNENAAKVNAQAKADVKAAKAAPSGVGRYLANTGVAVGKTGLLNPVGRTTIGGLGGLQAARGINELANMPIEELLKRYQAGERSPELLAAIQQAAGATAQTGFGAAATVPVFGAKTAKIKGAGALGTLGMGLYEGYKAVTEPNKVAP